MLGKEDCCDMKVFRLTGLPLAKLRARLDDILVAAFVDNRSLYGIRCHQRSDRSFFVRDRQFHVCARCTGMVSGLLFAPIGFLFPSISVFIFVSASALLLSDASTQLLGFRESTNVLRVITGFASSASMIGACAFLKGQVSSRFF